MVVIRGAVVDITDLLPNVHRQLSMLLSAEDKTPDFVGRLERLRETIETLQDSHADDCLFVLVQMLSRSDLSQGYCVSHALMSALVCLIVGPSAGLSAADMRPLTCAALTMNIAMAELQDQLAQQHQPPTESQRRVIAAHPLAGADKLRQWGVVDPVWLGLVEDHHECIDGSGYPSGKTELSLSQQLLRMTDRFVARISPRNTRTAQPPDRALSSLYQESERQDPYLRAAFVKRMGMYPPGTYVQLENHEVAVVVRRGPRVHTPVVMAIVDSQGMPHITPKKREPHLAGHAVKLVLPASEVRVRIDARRLLRRV